LYSSDAKRCFHPPLQLWARVVSEREKTKTKKLINQFAQSWFDEIQEVLIQRKMKLKKPMV